MSGSPAGRQSRRRPPVCCALVSRGWAKAEAAELYAAALERLPESDVERRRFATVQRSVNLVAAWHARFDQQSIRATGAVPSSGQDA
jgi:hypothetical protein